MSHPSAYNCVAAVYRALLARRSTELSRTRHTIVMIGLWLLCMYGSVCASSGIRPVPSEQYVTPKHIRYSFVVRNTTDTVIPTVQLWAYAPVPQTSHQWVEQIIASHPFTTSRDTVGNEVLAFQFPDFPPYAISVVHITVALKMVHSAQPMFEPAPERFLQAEPYIEIDDPAMLAAATRLRRESLLASSHTSYAWVSQYVASTAYIPEDRGALYALTHRTGDCTEFAYLLTALHRVNRIPSRVVGGYVVKGNAIIKATEYHNWTEFYHAGAWHIADAQKHHFMPHQIEYVAFRILASDNGGPLYNAHRFRYAGQGLSVLME